jgi:hypothetical protein
MQRIDLWPALVLILMANPQREIEQRMKDAMSSMASFNSGCCSGGTAPDRPLSERQKSANTTRSKVRARVEHVFGQQQSSIGGKIVRTIGIALARFKIGMMNLGSAGSARADGACARLSALTGGVGVSCKRPARRQSGPRSGGPPWHERRNRSLSQSRVLFEVPS